jgi:hypothetical protein
MAIFAAGGNSSRAETAQQVIDFDLPVNVMDTEK